MCFGFFGRTKIQYNIFLRFDFSAKLSCCEFLGKRNYCGRKFKTLNCFNQTKFSSFKKKQQFHQNYHNLIFVFVYLFISKKKGVWQPDEIDEQFFEAPLRPRSLRRPSQQFRHTGSTFFNFIFSILIFLPKQIEMKNVFQQNDKISLCFI